MTTLGKKPARQWLALIMSAHNEELVIENTIHSAVMAGMPLEHIYVVDDASTDRTAEIARDLLGRGNVLTVAHSGKGLALTRGAKRFKLSSRYEWIHVVDADCQFAGDYFANFRARLDPTAAAATGYVKSMRGSIISAYRVYEYTFGMEVVRRFQHMIGTIPIIPGPTSCFRADIFDKVRFDNGALAEDFDVTLQVHRQKLGKIQFIEGAVVYTQDPGTVRDFIRQITRWNRGVLQGFKRHRIGTRASKLDIYLQYQLLNCLSMVFSYGLIIPLAGLKHGLLLTMATAFLADVIMTLGLVFYTASLARRLDIMSAFPYIYMLRWISVGVFIKSYVEIMILRKFRGTSGAWTTPTRQRIAN
ncbi:glycosyltransferase [Candidatus Saccharibacteria bacterium]|nr:glycosyltransferase [Candidatus Saccharibacteria bacterium]